MYRELYRDLRTGAIILPRGSVGRRQIVGLIPEAYYIPTAIYGSSKYAQSVYGLNPGVYGYSRYGDADYYSNP